MSNEKKIELYKDGNIVRLRELTDDEYASMPYIIFSNKKGISKFLDSDELNEYNNLSGEKAEFLIKSSGLANYEKDRAEREKVAITRYCNEGNIDKDWDELTNEEKGEYINMNIDRYTFFGMLYTENRYVTAILDKYGSGEVWDALPVDVRASEMYYIQYGKFDNKEDTIRRRGDGIPLDKGFPLFTIEREQWIERLHTYSNETEELFKKFGKTPKPIKENVVVALANLSVDLPEVYQEILQGPKHRVTWMDHRPDFRTYLDNLEKKSITDEQKNIIRDRSKILIIKDVLLPRTKYLGMGIYNGSGKENGNEGLFSYHINPFKAGLEIYIVE